MASFPLRCIICSKSHNYSDISHLLTHIASKSHLSNYFQAQVRSHQDAELAQKLRTYDEWYAQNGMATLLSQRMLQKETRQKGKATPRPKSTIYKQDALIRRKAHIGDGVSHGLNSAIDPTLFNSKTEPGYDVPLPSTPKVGLGKRNLTSRLGENETTSPIELYRSYSYPSPHAHDHPRSLASCIPIYDEEFNQDGGYFESPVGGRADKMSDQQGDFEKSDMTKLKGVIWPGMSLFDAASPEARRMRNQKKDTSVLATMRANSQMVEPTEVIYFPSWEIKKERFISGDVESSPPPAEAPKKRKKITKCSSSRAPLTEVHPNTLVTQGSIGVRKSSRIRVGGGIEDLSERAKPRPGRHSNFFMRDEKHHLDAADRGIVNWKRASSVNTGNTFHGMDILHNGAERGESPSKQLPIPNGDHHSLCYPPLWGSQRSDETRYDIVPELWPIGQRFERSEQHSMDANAEKENIAPGRGMQHEQAPHGIAYPSWPKRRHHWSSEMGGVQLQRQMPPSTDVMGPDASSWRGNLGFAFTNPLSHQPYTRNQQGRTWTLTPTHSRPVKERPFSCGIPNLSFELAVEDDLAASSGDETIDQRIDDYGEPRQI